MTAVTTAGPMSWAGAGTARKLLAVAAFGVSALFLYYLDNLPSALDVEPYGQLEARSGKEILIVGPPPGGLINFASSAGTGLGVRAERARLAPDTLAALAAAGRLDGESRVDWLANPGNGGKVMVTVVLPDSGPDARVALAATGGANIPELRLRAVNQPLELRLQTLTGGEAERIPPTWLQVGETTVPQPWATLVPLRLVVPTGAAVHLRFPSSDALAGGAFRLGEQASSRELASAVPLREAVVLGRREGKVERRVCAAEEGAILLKLKPSASDCTEDGVLQATGLDLTPQSVSLQLAGSGFVMQNGTPVSSGLWTKIASNKVVAALLSIMYAALAGWLWKSFTARGGK